MYIDYTHAYTFYADVYNKAFVEKTPYCSCHAEAVSVSLDARLELMDRHTHRPSTVTLAAHARRGLKRCLRWD